MISGATVARQAFRFVGTVKFAVPETNLRSRRAVEKIGATSPTEPSSV